MSPMSEASEPPMPEPPMPFTVMPSKLDTYFSSSPEFTQHIRYVSGNTLERRKIPKEERWTEEKELGQGSYGAVWLERCIHGDNKDKLRAVKAVGKLHSSKNYRELKTIALFSHQKYEECFVKSYGWYDNEDSIFITMEYLPNGNLQNYLRSHHLPESEGKLIVSQVIEGLDFMHQFGFTHGDLKPARPNWWVKIADFGISERALAARSADQAFTHTFAAPEVLGFTECESYTNAVDIWSLGMITFLLLTGKAPYKEKCNLTQYVKDSSTFPLGILRAGNISEQGCQFVRSLMAPYPKDRLGAKESRGNPWIDSIPTLGIFTELKGHSKVRKVAFSPDGKLIASGSDDKTVRLWDSTTGASHATLKGHSLGISAIAFSPDGKLIASGSWDLSVRLWDSATGASRATIRGHSEPINAIAFSPDGKLIASGSKDKTVRLWDSATGASRATLEGHSGQIYAIAFSPNGKLIASASQNSTVRVWGAILP